jgi:hypothetical protein
MLNRKDRKPVLIALGIVVPAVLGFWIWIAYSILVVPVIVTGGHGPAVAATDLETFKRQIAIEAKAGLGLAEHSFRVREGTRGRLPLWGSGPDLPACRGNEGYAERVKLLDGERAGQTVWMCSDNVLIAIPMP